MRKNTFAILGILVILLLSFGITSAASENGFEISVIGAGSTSDNRISGNAGDTLSFTVQFNNTNLTYQDIDLTLYGTDIPLSQDSISGNATLTLYFTIPATQATESRILNGIVNSSGNTIGEISDSVYYTVLDSEIPGCTDENASNYNSEATTDDGSCTYATTADTLCELEGYDEDGNLEISNFDIKNNGEGKDDRWQYLDDIKINVKVKNTADYNIDDVEVKIVILDDKMEDGGNDVTSDFDIEDEVLTSIGRLRDGDKEEVTFSIGELPTDLNDGTYYMYIMAYENGNEEEQCISEIDSGDFYFSFRVEPVEYKDSIVVRGSELEEQVDTYCGQQNLEIRVPVYNIGDDTEKKVLVNLYNSELGIDEYKVIDDLDKGDKETVSFFIDIPSQLAKDEYNLDAIVSFDWDDNKKDDDPFSYNEENSKTSIKLNILECKAQIPTITATLESSTEVGQNLLIKLLITNNGNNNTFLITPTEFDSWATLISTTPGMVAIPSGSTHEVMITLSPTEAGTHSFRVSTIVNGETYNQPISVNISEKPGIFSTLGLSTTSLYLIAGIIALIILIFLVLLIKIARRPRI